MVLDNKQGYRWNFRTEDVDLHMYSKIEGFFCTKIKGAKSDFRKISGCKVSLPQYLRVQLHSMHPH